MTYRDIERLAPRIKWDDRCLGRLVIDYCEDTEFDTRKRLFILQDRHDGADCQSETKKRYGYKYSYILDSFDDMDDEYDPTDDDIVFLDPIENTSSDLTFKTIKKFNL